MISAFGVDHGDISKASPLPLFFKGQVPAYGVGRVARKERAAGESVKWFKGKTGKAVRDIKLEQAGLRADSGTRAAYHVGMHRNRYLAGGAGAAGAGGGAAYATQKKRT